METKTFREVHEELEKEYLFIQKKHDIKNFEEKARLLKSAGFTNSIATKIYDAISKNQKVVSDYQNKYRGLYKFILKPQLERVCEKYNLYVRPPKFFLGDIPEKNIRDIENFYVYVNDILPDYRILRTDKNFDLFTFEKDLYNMVNGAKIHISKFEELGISHLISVAAVKNLFSDEAFQKTTARIINNSGELEPKNKVELDPIVLCETAHGYLIITAWGDEANDELIANQNMN